MKKHHAFALGAVSLLSGACHLPPQPEPPAPTSTQPETTQPHTYDIHPHATSTTTSTDISSVPNNGVTKLKGTPPNLYIPSTAAPKQTTTLNTSPTSFTVDSPPTTNVASPTTRPRPATTRATVLPEQTDDHLSDEEWLEKERLATGQRALVSWYGSESGSRTANGEAFDGSGLTFAHKTMRFGTMVRFCTAEACVVARCTDRGPFVGGREFDLSRAAFAAIAPLGAGVVEVAWSYA